MFLCDLLGPLRKESRIQDAWPRAYSKARYAAARLTDTQQVGLRLNAVLVLSDVPDGPSTLRAMWSRART